MKARCAQTVAVPELNEITVLANVKCNGFNISIPIDVLSYINNYCRDSATMRKYSKESKEKNLLQK